MRTMAAVMGLLLLPAAASAQDTLANAVRFLVTNQAVQTGDFERDREAAETAHEAIARALLLDLASAPIGTSSGGFLYRLNPELGTVERASENFGTFFVERALLGGAGNVSFGMTGSTVGYDSLNGYALRDGSFVTVANQFRGEAAPFDTESLTMRLRSETMRDLRQRRCARRAGARHRRAVRAHHARRRADECLSRHAVRAGDSHGLGEWYGRCGASRQVRPLQLAHHEPGRRR